MQTASNTRSKEKMHYFTTSKGAENFAELALKEDYEEVKGPFIDCGWFVVTITKKGADHV